MADSKKELEEAIRNLNEVHRKAFYETIMDPESWKPGPKVFKIMRIIDCRIVHVDGIGGVMFHIDFKYGRQWARRWEG